MLPRIGSYIVTTAVHSSETYFHNSSFLEIDLCTGPAGDVAAGMIFCFGFVAKTVLVTRWCFGCWTQVADSGQPALAFDLTAGNPAWGRVLASRWSLSFLPTQAILWFYGCQEFLFFQLWFNPASLLCVDQKLGKETGSAGTADPSGPERCCLQYNGIKKLG